MKKVFLFFYLFTFLSCVNVSSQDEISPAEFEKQLAAQQSQLLDVRTAGEYQSGHLKNSLQADWLNQEQFADRVKYLDKSKPLLVYCASGIRSAAAAKWLLNNGFTNVQNLKGGVTSWKLEGRPMEGADDNTQMGIDDYNQLTISNQVVLVDFGAEWCPPCKKMEPVLQRLQKELPNQFKLVKVDGGNDLEVMKAQKVDAIPVFIIYKNGKEVWRKQGVVAFTELKQQLAL